MEINFDRERKLAKRGKHKVHGRRLLELIGNSQENKLKKKRGCQNRNTEFRDLDSLWK